MHFIEPIFALIAMLIVAVLIVRMIIENGKSKREAEAQLQLHTRLIDKFGSANELLDYLQSEAGKRFLAPATAQKMMPYRRILAATQTGIVLTFVGVGLWLIRGFFDVPALRAVTFLASISLTLGLGFLCSAVTAHILSRKWGLLNGNGTGPSKGH